MASYERSEGRYRFSGPHGSDVARVSIEALSNDWLDVWYQPKIDLRRKCVAGAEVLVRMHHSQAGLLWPEDYLSPLDEERLLKLSEYPLVTSMRHWTVFAEAGFGLRLSINVPASLLPKIPVSAIVAAHRPQSEKWPGLILELTEDQIVRDLPAIRQIAKELKPSAIALAIDEFGAGYSSFSSLRDLLFTELKPHVLFVKNCAVDVTAAAICQTAIDLAHRFGSVVVAEGIDAIADLQALIVMRCDLGQGTLLTPPLPHLCRKNGSSTRFAKTRKPRAADQGSQESNERVA